jgi:hypothetical protein
MHDATGAPSHGCLNDDDVVEKLWNARRDDRGDDRRDRSRDRYRYGSSDRFRNRPRAPFDRP